jgi:multidrug efflux system membrane fusion protein
MGYEEPGSSRQATAFTPERPLPPPRGLVRRIVLLGVALAVIGFVASKYDVTDPQAALSKISTDVGSLFGGNGGGGRVVQRGNLQAPPVRVATATVGDIPVMVKTIGTVLANSTVLVKSQVDGPLLAASFREGQMVKKGDLLFRIDPAPFEAALRQSQAQMQRDQAQLASAQADADRAMMLAERGIVSAQQRDQLVASAKALAATVEADKAAVERAQLNLGYTTIRSPINGKTGAYIVHPGNQVHASDQAGLVNITEIQPVKISFNLPQGDLPQLQNRLNEGALIAGVTVRSDIAVAAATLADSADKEIQVKVDFIGNVVEARTGTIELRATFDNPDLRLVPGELVDVSVRLETLRKTVIVPRDSVNVGQGGNYVFVVDSDGKAQMKPVRVLYQDQAIAALGSGVEENDRVITDGQLRVTPGAPVVITEPEGVSAQSANIRTANPDSAASQAAGGRAAGTSQSGRGG